LAKLLPVLVRRRNADGLAGVPLPGAATSVLDALAARASGQMSGENFPVALRLLPRGPRHELATVYRFARFVDDVGDEAPGGPVERLALLDEVGDDVRALERGQARLAPVAGLAPLVASGRLPIQPLLDLVEANRVDQVTASYETFEHLMDYCRLSAAPVGQIVLHVAGAANPRNVEDSDAVCAALQILEHCQDVGEDLGKGRVYLPQSDLRAHGVDRPDLAAGSTSDGLRRVVALEVERSRQLLRAGRPLVGRLTGWARLAVAGYVAGGLAVVDALEAARFDVLGSTVRPSRLRTVRHALTELRATR
jgi:squalene synthase HpnC